MKRQLNVRFLLIMLVSVVAVCVGAYVAHAYQSRRHADYLVKRGHEAEEKGETDLALQYYSKYLAFKPNDGPARGRYGMILAQKAVSPRQKEGAFITLERALRDDPSLTDVRRKAIDVAIEIYRFTDARVNLEALLKASPDDPDLLNQLGRCSEEEGRILDAIAEYQTVIRKAPDRVETYRRLAAIYARDNREAADKVMADMIAKNPQSIRARLIRSQYFRVNGETDLAREDLKAAQSVANPGELEAEVLLASAELALVAKQPDEARRLFTRGRQLAQRDLRFTLGLANLELRDGRRDEALKILREATASQTDKPEEIWAIVDLMIDANETAEAEKLLASLDGKIDKAPIDFQTARIRMQRGEINPAVRLLVRCRTEFLRIPDLHLQTELLLANCYERLGQTELRLDACQKAVALDGKSKPARLARARALFASDKVDEGVRELQVLRDMKSDYRIKPDVRIMIAEIRLAQASVRDIEPGLRQQLLSSAASELDGTPENDKDTAEFRIVQARLLIAGNKRVEARKELEKARDKHPNDIVYWQALATLAAIDGKPSDGLAILKQAQDKIGDTIELKLARIALLRGDKPEAATFRLFETGLDALPPADRDRLMMALVLAYEAAKSPDDSLRLLRTLAVGQPNNLDILARLFEATLAKGTAAELEDLVARIRKAEGEDGVLWLFNDARRNWLIYGKDKSPATLQIAKDRLADARKRRPNWSMVALAEAEIEDGTGNVEAAIEKYKAAIQLGVRNDDVIRRTVQLLALRNRFDEAREQLQVKRKQVTDLDGSLGRVAVGLALIQDETTAGTVAMAERLVEKSTNYRDQVWLGIVYSSNVRSAIDESAKKAEKSYRKAVEMDPTAPDAWTALVEFLVQLDRLQGKDEHDGAKAEIAKAEKALPADKKSRALAPCYDAVGDKAEAEKHYALLVKESPNDFGLLRNQIAHYEGVGEIEKAIPILRRMIDIAPVDSDLRRWARRRLAMDLIGGGDFARTTEALVLLDANLRERDKNPEDLRAQAIVNAYRPGGRQKSIKELEDSSATLGLTPGHEFLLARLHDLDGNWLKAKERMESLLTKGGKRNPIFYAYYIQALLRRNDVSTATVWFNRLDSMTKQSERLGIQATVVELRARIWVKQGKKSEAADLLKAFAGKVLKEKKYPAVLRDIGRLLAELKLTVDAEELLRQYVKEVEAKSPAAVLVLAEFLARDDRVGEAIRLCGGALKTAGPELSSLIAVSAVRLGKASPDDYKAAGAVIDEAIRIKPQSIELQVSLAEFRDAQGRYGEAIERYRAILAKEPRSGIALNNIAWLLAFQDGKAAEALEFIDKAIQMSGEQANLLDTKGMVLIQLGRPDDAIKVLGEAIVQSRSPEALYHLALAHHKAGQALETGRTWRQALEAGFTTKNLHPLEKPAYDSFVKVQGDQ